MTKHIRLQYNNLRVPNLNSTEELLKLKNCTNLQKILEIIIRTEISKETLQSSRNEKPIPKVC